MKPFEVSEDNTAFLSGYGKCLKEMYLCIAELTEYNPKNRYIDSVFLLDKISATSDVISKKCSVTLKQLEREIQVTQNPVLALNKPSFPSIKVD